MWRWMTGAAALIVLSGCATPDPAMEHAARSPADALALHYDTVDIRALPQRPVGAPALARSTVLDHIAFGSCLGQTDPAPALRAAARSDADLFVLLGDNVYGDAYSGNMELYELRQAYTDLASHPDFAALNSAKPISPSWDDHDYGLNDAGGDFSGKYMAETMFEHFWRVPADDPRRAREGIYFSEIYGTPGREVHLIHLDTRFFRSTLKPTDERGAPGKERYLPDPDPSKTMLGEEQWTWLAEELARPADVKIVVTSIQVIADGHGWEAWRHLPAQRDRLYALINDIAPPNLMIVSGDRHAAGMYRKDDVGGAPLYELTASSINKSFRDSVPDDQDEAGPFRLGPRYFRENYGAITIDWERAVATLLIHDNQGGVVQSRAVPLTL